MPHDALITTLDRACGPETPPEALQEGIAMVEDRVREHEDRIVGLCRRFVSDPDQALALSQQGIVSTIHRLGQWRGQGPLWPWIYGVVRDLCLADLAHRRDLLTADGVLIPGSPLSSTLSSLRREAFEVLVREATSGVLLTDEQDVVHLRYVEGLEPAQINEVMQFEGTGARGLLQRCRHKLGRVLRNRWSGAGIDGDDVAGDLSHPSTAELALVAPDGVLKEHLAQCPRCRVDRRRLAAPLSVPPRDLEAMRGALGDARRRGLSMLCSSWRSMIRGDRDDASRMGLLPHGTRIGGYRVDGLIQRTGSVQVYRAAATEGGGRVRLEILAIRHRVLLKRLARDGHHLVQFRHPNTTSVVGHLEVSDGLTAVVLDEVDGPTLRDLLVAGSPLPRRGATPGMGVPLEWIDALAIDILSGVAAGHASGMIHRDLRPENVLLDVSNERLVARVTGYGLASVLAAVERTPTYGSAAYLAPEQQLDPSLGDARSDVFALGALLYELCTSQVCFAGVDAVDTVRRVHALDYVPCTDLRPDLPDRMIQALAACLRIDLDARPKNAAALLDLWTRGAGDAARPRDLADVAQIAALRGLRPIAPLPIDLEATEHETPATLIGGTPAPIGAISAIEPRGGAMATFFAGMLILGGGAAAVVWSMRVPSRAPTFWSLAAQIPTGVEPTLSPDGRRVAFSDQSDVYVVRVDGGAPEVWTLGLDAAATQPAWSPDGTRLAFAADGGLWWMSAGGVPERVVDRGDHPAWFPDGDRVAFGAGRGLHIVSVSSGRIDPVVETDRVVGIAVDPEGERVAWVDEARTLRIVPLDGGQPSWVADDVVSPRWLDPRTLAAVCGGGSELCVWRDAGPAGFEAPESWLVLPNRVATFDARGGRVVVGRDQPRFGLLRILPGDPPQGTVEASDGRGQRRVASPDGTAWAALTVGGEGGDEATIVTSRRPDAGVASGRGLGRPAWRPDSDRLTFSGEIAGQQGVFEVPAGGGDLEQIGDIPASGRVWWSPTGRQLALTWSTASGPVPIVVEPDLPWAPQLELARLAPIPGRGAGPFSPDGSILVVERVAGGVQLVELATRREVAVLADADAVAWAGPDALIVVTGPRIERYDVSLGGRTSLMASSPWTSSRPADLVVDGEGTIWLSVERQDGGLQRVEHPWGAADR